MSRLVEYLDRGAVRETTGPGQGPVVETDKARLNVITFLASNPAASQAAAAMQLCGVATVNDYLAPRAGKIVGLAVRSNADLTAGNATFQAKVGANAAGVTVVLSDLVQQKITNFSAGVAFSAGDLLSVTLATDSGYLPVTADHQANLLIEWSPVDG